MSRSPEAVVVNGLYPEVADADLDGDPWVDLWASRRKVNDRELDRLRSVWAGPMVEIPLLPIDPGPQLVEIVGQHLEWVEPNRS
jgi:hypothetical protein